MYIVLCIFCVWCCCWSCTLFGLGLGLLGSSVLLLIVKLQTPGAINDVIHLITNCRGIQNQARLLSLYGSTRNPLNPSGNLGLFRRSHMNLRRTVRLNPTRIILAWRMSRHSIARSTRTLVVRGTLLVTLLIIRGTLLIVRGTLLIVRRTLLVALIRRTLLVRGTLAALITAFLVALIRRTRATVCVLSI